MSIRARLLATWFIVLAALVGWRTVTLYAQIDDTSAAAASLTHARNASEDIRRLAPRPATALDPRITDAQILRAVQDALQQAGIPAAAIRELGIDARADERATISTDVIRRSGRVSLDSTSLPLIGATFNSLRARLPAIRIENIRMQRASAPDAPSTTFRVTIGFVGYISNEHIARTEPTPPTATMPTPIKAPQPRPQ